MDPSSAEHPQHDLTTLAGVSRLPPDARPEDADSLVRYYLAGQIRNALRLVQSGESFEFEDISILVDLEKGMLHPSFPGVEPRMFVGKPVGFGAGSKLAGVSLLVTADSQNSPELHFSFAREDGTDGSSIVVVKDEHYECKLERQSRTTLRGENLTELVKTVVRDAEQEGVDPLAITPRFVAERLGIEPKVLGRVHAAELITTPQKIEFALQELRERAVEVSRLPELAKEMGVTPVRLRLSMLRYGREAGISWSGLGVSLGPELNSERAWLREFASDLKSLPQQVLVVHEVLQLLENRRVSPLGAFALIASIKTGDYTYDTLDRRVAIAKRSSSKNVSAALLGSSRRERVRTGMLSEIDQALLARYQVEVRTRSRDSTYRNFAKRFVQLRRAYAGRDLFRYCMEEGTLSVQVAEQFVSILARLSDQKAKDPSGLNDTQRKILEKLVVQKGEGTYRSKADVARECEVSPSMVKRALEGQNGNSGAIEKVISHIRQADPEKAERVHAAMSELTSKAKTITPQAYALLSEAVKSCPNNYITDAISEQVRPILTSMIDRRLRGEPVDLTTMAKLHGIGDSHLRSLMHGKHKKEGAYSVLQRQIDALPEKEREQLLSSCVPCELTEYREIAALIPKMFSEMEQKPRVRQDLLGVLDSVVQSLSERKSLVVYEQDKAIKRKRPLTGYERGELLQSYVSGKYPTLKSLHKDLQAVLRSRVPIVVGFTTFKRFFIGRTDSAREVKGAIQSLRERLDERPLVAGVLKTLSQDHTSDDLQVSELGMDSRRLDYALAILRQTGLRDLSTALNRFLLKRVGTFEEIAGSAAEVAKGRGWEEVSTYFDKLRERFEFSFERLLDQGVVKVMADTFGALSGTAGDCLVTIPFVTACKQSGISASELGRFYAQAYDTADPLARSTMALELVKIAYTQDSVLRLSRVRNYADRVYQAFLQQSFPELEPHKLTPEERRRFSALEERAGVMRQHSGEFEDVIRQRVHQFYESYNVETVIKWRRSHLIRSAVHPEGQPLNSLVEVGHDAVLEAASKYDPDSFLKEGKDPPSFKTYAVNMILWKTSQQSRTHRSQTAGVERNLEDRISEDTEFGDLLEYKGGDDEELDHLQETRYEKIQENLRLLSPLEQAVLQLRFGLDSESDPRGEIFETIAHKLAERGLTERPLTVERIRQIMEASLGKLRESVLDGAPEEWSEFLREVPRRERPEPLPAVVEGGRLRVCEDLELDGFRDFEGETLVVTAGRMSHIQDQFWDLLLEVRSKKMDEVLALYSISIENGAVTLAARIDDSIK